MRYPHSVIPAHAGIHSESVVNTGFRRYDSRWGMAVLTLLFLLLLPAGVLAKDWEDAPKLRIRILDRVTAQTHLYDLDVGHTVTYNNLRILPKTCRHTGPLDEPESAAFMQIWEVEPKPLDTNTGSEKSSWVFSGWMFASSPSLSAVDHPVYDVWLIDCIDPNAKPQSETQDKTPVAKSSKTPASSSDTNEQSTISADDSPD